MCWDAGGIVNDSGRISGGYAAITIDESVREEDDNGVHRRLLDNRDCDDVRAQQRTDVSTVVQHETHALTVNAKQLGTDVDFRPIGVVLHSLSEGVGNAVRTDFVLAHDLYPFVDETLCVALPFLVTRVLPLTLCYITTQHSGRMPNRYKHRALILSYPQSIPIKVCHADSGISALLPVTLCRYSIVV